MSLATYAPLPLDQTYASISFTEWDGEYCHYVVNFYVNWDKTENPSGWVSYNWHDHLCIRTQASKSDLNHYNFEPESIDRTLKLLDLERLTNYLRLSERKFSKLKTLEGNGDWASVLGQRIRSLGITHGVCDMSIWGPLNISSTTNSEEIGLVINKLRAHWNKLIEHERRNSA